MKNRTPDAAVAGTEPVWLGALRRYLVVLALASLAWEIAHTPLYTIWRADGAFHVAVRQGVRAHH